MATGLECCGIVLAVIPLIIEGAKVYSRGIDSVRDMAQPCRFDEALDEFYEEIFCQLVEFKERVQFIIDSLPGLDNARKASIVEAFSEDDWTADSDIALAFRARLEGENDFLAFEVIVKKVVREMGQLVEDRAVHISKSDASVSQMYIKLKSFQESRVKKQTTSSLADRFKFRVRQKDRAKSLKMINTWNKRLERFVSRLSQAPVVQKGGGAVSTTLFGQIRQLLDHLYKTLSEHWTCVCPNERRVKLRLQARSARTTAAASASIQEHTFDLLFSTVAAWQEGKALLRALRNSKSNVQFAPITASVPKHTNRPALLTKSSLKSSKSLPLTARSAKPPVSSPSHATPVAHASSTHSSDEKQKVDHLCEVIQTASSYCHCVNLLIEQAAPQIWKTRGEPGKLHLLDLTKEIKLESILHSLPDDLRAQRWLGVHLSHSLLHLHEGPWLNDSWGKEKITFFPHTTGDLDLDRPYVTTNIQPYTPQTQSMDLNQIHGNPSLLSLGIILIEIHTGKPIESFRLPDDLTNGTQVNVNTDFTAALRVAKSLRNCSMNYQEAVQACLSMPWRTPAQKVSLSDDATRDSVYQYIISPLEEDLEHMFRVKV